MPYGISDQQPDCAGWAAVKLHDDGSVETMGCHQVKQDAIDQMVAVSLQEGIDPIGDVNKRHSMGVMALLVNIDETLLHNSVEPMQDMIDGVNNSDYAVYVVTDRDESQREATLQALADAGVEYVGLIMRPVDMSDIAEFKRQAAMELMSMGVSIDAAVDSDQASLDAYTSLGIEAYSPAGFMLYEVNEPGEEGEEMNSGTLDIDTQVYANRHMDLAVDATHWISSTLDERRSVAYTTLELRANENGDGNTFIGYAAMFDSPSEPLPYTEFVRAGAFAKTLNDGADVRLLIDHEGVPLARTRSGTLTLAEDERGLRVEAELDPMNPDAQRVISAMRRGDLSQMSFAFRTVKDSWNADRSVRELREVQLFDVSVVTYPAYEDTIAELRRAQPAIVAPSGSLLARKRQIQIARQR